MPFPPLAAVPPTPCPTLPHPRAPFAHFFARQGKTTVARIYGQILRELGLLSKGDVVLSTPSDLIGSALGQSEEKTNALLDKSEGW